MVCSTRSLIGYCYLILARMIRLHRGPVQWYYATGDQAGRLLAPQVCEKGGADAHQMPGVHVVKSHQFLVNIQVGNGPSWKWL